MYWYWFCFNLIDTVTRKPMTTDVTNDDDDAGDDDYHDDLEQMCVNFAI